MEMVPLALASSLKVVNINTIDQLHVLIIMSMDVILKLKTLVCFIDKNVLFLGIQVNN
jgi:hypothetical protein